MNTRKTLQILVCDNVHVEDRVLRVQQELFERMYTVQNFDNQFELIIFNPACSWQPSMARCPSASFTSTYFSNQEQIA